MLIKTYKAVRQLYRDLQEEFGHLHNFKFDWLLMKIFIFVSIFLGGMMLICVILLIIFK